MTGRLRSSLSMPISARRYAAAFIRPLVSAFHQPYSLTPPHGCRDFCSAAEAAITFTARPKCWCSPQYFGGMILMPGCAMLVSQGIPAACSA
jgi:hypothetical protein